MRLVGLVAGVVAGAIAGCGPSPAPEPARSHDPVGLVVDVFGDSGRSERWRRDTALAAPRETAAVWLARVSPSRAPAEPPLPVPESSAPALEPAPPPGLAIDPDLKPPILRAPAPLHAPGSLRGEVELDVRVDEEGLVSDAEWAGGSRDTALVRAATECALAMRFYPALREGAPVAVWCRQRFDFGARPR